MAILFIMLINKNKGVVKMAEKVKAVDVVVEVVKVSRESYDSSLSEFDTMGKKHKLSEAIVEDMKENYKKTHMIKGSKIDTHIIRLSNMDETYKQFLGDVHTSVLDFNLLLITNGVTLPKRKRGETIEYEAQPQLKLVVELFDIDKPMK